MADKPTILLAEDEQALRSALSYQLESEGFTVLQARDGEEAIRIAKDRHPQLILLDMIMPVKDGFEVLRVLKEDTELQGTPVIALTNLADATNEKKARDQGVTDYLVKSDLDMADVVTKIRSILKLT